MDFPVNLLNLTYIRFTVRKLFLQNVIIPVYEVDRLFRRYMFENFNVIQSMLQSCYIPNDHEYRKAKIALEFVDRTDELGNFSGETSVYQHSFNNNVYENEC